MGEEYIAQEGRLIPDGIINGETAENTRSEESASADDTVAESCEDEELSDAEYAALIGEEEVQDVGDDAVEESIESPVFESLAGDSRKKRRKDKGKQAVSENGDQDDNGQEKRKVHTIGGTDTLRTGSAVSDLLKDSVRAGIAGTQTAEGFYKDCIILSHEKDSHTYDSRRDKEVLQKTASSHTSGDSGAESFHEPPAVMTLQDHGNRSHEGRGISAPEKPDRHDDKGEKTIRDVIREKEKSEIYHYEDRKVLPASEQKEHLYQSATEIAEKAAVWRNGATGEETSDAYKSGQITETADREMVRRFTMHRPATIIRDMERGGRSFSHAVRSFASGRDTAEQAGERSLRKYLGAAVDVTDLLAILGGRATAEIQKERSRAFTESAVNMERALESGKLKQSDLLLTKRELCEKIRKVGLKPYESWGIVKNRHAIHDALVTKEVLLKLKDENPDQKHVFAQTKVFGKNVIGVSAYESRKQVGLLTSERGKLYNNYQYSAWTRNMIRAYFASQPDPMLKKLNPAGMNIREIKALIANAERYHLSVEQVSVLRVLLMGKKVQKNRMMDKYLSGLGGAFRSVKALGRKGIILFERVDDVSVEGYRKLATIYHGVRTVKPMVKLAGTAGITAVRTVGNLPPVAYARHQAARQLKRGMRTLSSVTAAQGRRAGTAVRIGTAAFRKNAGGRVKTAKSAVAGLKGTAGAGGLLKSGVKGGIASASAAPRLKTAGGAVKTIGVTAGNVKKGIRRIRRSRPVRFAGFVGGRLRDGVYFATAPVRVALSGIAHIREAIRKVLAAVLAVIFAVLLIFILLLLFSAFITTIGNSTGEIIEGVVTDGELAEHIRHLNNRNAERFQEAVTLAKEPPRHDADRIDAQGLYPDEAYHGVHLYHYGSPKIPDAADANIYHNDLPGTPPAGYHYYYIDANGQTIANHTANTKDIICLTSVMVVNDYDEEVLTAAPELMDLWFDYLNPLPTYTVSPLYHKEGTDRFPYDGYTFEGQTYYCTDSTFYTAFDAAEADHVQFYDRPKPYSEKGCKTDWDAYDAARDDWWEERPEYPDYPDYGDYEDEDDWQEALDDYQDAVDVYWEAHDTWSNARPQLSDYRYCPGHEALSCSYGYRDINIYVTVLTKDDVYRAAENGNVLTYRVPKDYACTEWEERGVTLDIPAGYAGVTAQFVRDGGFSNPKYQEWCDRLYGGDWYSMYGVDTYSDGVSLPTGEGALTQEQIDEMIARIGDVSEARAEIISFALDHVWRIPYYWGGKASVPGFEGNHFGSIVEADYKGRNRKGLDCSGFVGWVYWSVIGVKPSPAMSTGDIVPSLHLRRISFTDLRPGDIGMEDLPGASSNHIGYFVGFDENGRAKWAHCSSGAGGVTVNTTNCFRYYYRLFED